MMRLTALAAAAALAALPAAAQTFGGDIGGNNQNANVQSGTNSAISTGPLGSGNTTTATGGAGGAGGSASALGGRGGAANVTNSGAAGSVNITSQSRLQAPGVALGLANAYCGNSAGVGGSGPGFSFSAIVGRHDVDCRRVSFALLLEAMGRREEALLVLANNAEVRAALVEAHRQREAARFAAPPVRPAGVRAEAGSIGPSPADCRRMAIALRDTRRRADAAAVAARDYFDAHCGEAGPAR